MLDNILNLNTLGIMSYKGSNLLLTKFWLSIAYNL